MRNCWNFLKPGFYEGIKNNLSLLFFYFAEEKTLVSVDIDTLLRTKLNKMYIEDIQSMGYLILGWENFYRYFDAVLNFKGHRPRRRGKCAHYWVLESQDEAFKRSRSRKYSMGRRTILTPAAKVRAVAAHDVTSPRAAGRKPSSGIVRAMNSPSTM